MIIFCSGMPRSASTWSYNVCRLLLESTATEFYAGYVGEAEQTDAFIQTRCSELDTRPAETPGSTPSTLIKCHTPGPHCRQLIEQEQAKNIYTYRDLRDSLASRLVFEDISFDVALRRGLYQANWLTWCTQHGATLSIRYDTIIHTPKAAIAEIASYLNIPLSPGLHDSIYQQTRLESVKRVADQVSQPANQDTFQVDNYHAISRSTLIHSNHISNAKIGRWKDELSPEQQLIATLAFRPYLIRLEFETETSLQAIANALMQSLDWWAIAQRCLEQGHYRQALSLFSYGLELNPHDHRCGWYVGGMLVLLNQPQEAEQVWLQQLMEVSAEDMEEAIADLLHELEQVGDRLRRSGREASAQVLKEHQAHLHRSVLST